MRICLTNNPFKTLKQFKTFKTSKTFKSSRVQMFKVETEWRAE